MKHLTFLNPNDMDTIISEQWGVVVASDATEFLHAQHKEDNVKHIQNYQAEKYANSVAYEKVEEGIYKFVEDDEVLYVTSLSFEQEPEFEEGSSADDISQYPLEDILDKFFCHIRDFYEGLNKAGSNTCYLEFASLDINDVKELRSIIGKHVYNKEDGESVHLIIE